MPECSSAQCPSARAGALSRSPVSLYLLAGRVRHAGFTRCARSSTDRVADFESEGCRFESYRARFLNNGLRRFGLTSRISCPRTAHIPAPGAKQATHLYCERECLRHFSFPGTQVTVQAFRQGCSGRACSNFRRRSRAELDSRWTPKWQRVVHEPWSAQRQTVGDCRRCRAPICGSMARKAGAGNCLEKSEKRGVEAASLTRKN